MATFARLAAWPVGYFRAYSGWFLRHRQTVATRISTLNAEIERIGFIKVQYRTVSSPDGNTVVEERTGFSVTEGSTLEKLVQAYITNGGNPLDISTFAYPQSSKATVSLDGEATIDDEYPHGGVIYPLSAEPNEPLPSGSDTGYGVYPGGMLDSTKYFASRQGGRISTGAYDHDAIVKGLHHIRAWANQDIKEVLTDLEARIIKQCDLREQLIHERDDVLVQAFGGVLKGVGYIDPERFDTNLMVQNLVQDVSETVYEKMSDGVRLIPKHRTDAYLAFTFPAEPADQNVALSV